MLATCARPWVRIVGPRNQALDRPALDLDVDVRRDRLIGPAVEVPATVIYSGLTQRLAGLYQINAVVPPGVSGVEPVVVTVGSTYSSYFDVMIALQ